MPHPELRTRGRAPGLLAAMRAVLTPRGRIPPVVQLDGEVAPNSIAEKVFVELNGHRHGMIIRGADCDAPVLLFLSGGPGIPEYLLEAQYPSGLEEQFTVVHWSYRGTGLSYDSSLAPASLTTATYLDDILAVTNYLRQRFGQDRIYLMAHSFGTSLGLQMAAEHPQFYRAYLAMSQIVDQPASERLAIQFMTDAYRAKGNERMARKLAAFGSLARDDELARWLSSPLRDKAMHQLGVGTTRHMRSVITGIFWPSLRLAEFTAVERVNIWRGKALLTEAPVTRDSFAFDAAVLPGLQIPVFFLTGSHDYTCNHELQRSYFEQIQAPIKRFYSFTDSAHSPVFEQRDLARKVCAEIVVQTEQFEGR